MSHKFVEFRAFQADGLGCVGKTLAMTEDNNCRRNFNNAGKPAFISRKKISLQTHWAFWLARARYSIGRRF
jgi:hypothetical protein